MALAILRVEDSDDVRHVLALDTGTSAYYRVHLGTGVRREDGFLLLEAPYWTSGWQTNPKAGRHLDTRVQHRLEAAQVTEPRSLVQLETARGLDGRGRAVSAPVRLLGRRAALPVGGPAMTLSTTAAGHPIEPRPGARLSPVRTVAVRSAADTFSRSASIADLIGSLVQAAAPVVLDLLGHPSNSDQRPAPAASVLADVVRQLLASLARGPGSTGQTTAAGTPGARAVPVAEPPPPAVPSTMPTATPSSIATWEANRLVPYARPMVFGIDDALLGALAGPVLSNVAGPLIQLLPQLLNAANQQKLARQELTNQQVSNLLSQVNRSILLDQLTFARGAHGAGAPGTPNDADLAALQALLRTAAVTAAPAGTPATAAASRPASLPGTPGPEPIASRAVLTMVTGPDVTRLGRSQTVFVGDQATTLRFRLDVGAGGPTSPLARAKLEISAREPGGATDLLRVTRRLTDLTPGSELAVPLTPEQSGALPRDTELEVLAHLRWPGARGTYQATASRTVVLATRTIVRDRGDLVGSPVELTDMNRYRAFWNKVWASTGGTADEALPLWGVDVALRYSVIGTASDHGNGLMTTRTQRQPQDEGLRVTTRGRMKSGLEVSVHELNRLLPLWPGETELTPDDLAAFTAPGWLAAQGGDAITQVRMEGPRDTRGQVWAVPVLKLRAFTIAEATEVDPYGQVVATRDHPVHFPVVETVRVLGLRSLKDAGESGDAVEAGTSEAPASYRFDGYDVVLNSLVGLDPARPLPAASRPGALAWQAR